MKRSSLVASALTGSQSTRHIISEISFQQPLWVGTECPRYRDKLDKVDPPFPTLVFGNEGLRLVECFRQSLLAHTRVLSRRNKKID